MVDSSSKIPCDAGHKRIRPKARVDRVEFRDTPMNLGSQQVAYWIGCLDLPPCPRRFETEYSHLIHDVERIDATEEVISGDTAASAGH